MPDYLKCKTHKEKVLFFIAQFKNHDKDDVIVKTFTLGCCYYFALILRERFGATILYDNNNGHFVSKIGRYLYDINGDVTEKYKGIKLYKEKEWMNLPNKDEIICGCIKKYVD